MTENRHLKRIFLLILTSVSVFFISSCGEPTFINLPEITIQPDAASISSRTDENFTFSVSCNDVGGEMTKINKDAGPGMIFVYIIFRNSQETDYVNYINNGTFFNIVSDYSSNVQYGIFTDSNNVLFNTKMTYGESGELVKPVRILEGRGGVSVGAPTYNYNFRTNSSIIDKKLTMQLTEANTDKCIIKLSDGNVREEHFEITNKGNYSQNDTIYICLFASLTPGSGDFSNLFFSTLSYIGTFTAQIR